MNMNCSKKESESVGQIYLDVSCWSQILNIAGCLNKFKHFLHCIVPQAVAEKAKLEEECELLMELLMLKNFKNLTDNRLNSSSAKRRSVPQKKAVKAADQPCADESRQPNCESDVLQEYASNELTG